MKMNRPPPPEETISLLSDDDDSKQSVGVSNMHKPPHSPRTMSAQRLGDKKDECFAHVYAILPDLCPSHLEEWYLHRGEELEHRDASNVANDLIALILENVEKGTHYPKREQVPQGVKRKREQSATEQAQQMYGAPDRDDANTIYKLRSTVMLAAEFPRIPKSYITKTLNAAPTRHLFNAYKALEEDERTLSVAKVPPYTPLKGLRVDKYNIYGPQHCESTITNMEQSLAKNPHQEFLPDELRAAKELLAARKACQEASDQRASIRRLEEEELRNIEEAEREGTMKDCGCCFSEYPLNRMVHCNSEGDLHWFCRACAKLTVETVIGNSKYEITCMSMDGCEASFSRDQMEIFLDKKSFIALERNEQETVLRMAGIENLASCPFCPFAAEYPPVEVDKEFRCQAPDCRKVSCRLCQLETHIPKSCGEFAQENGLSIRRLIEEAMTAALVRTCNKCKTPFVKELGCNKMTCMRAGCYNVQCYVCSKSCTYDHFDDERRGGHAGNCPLFENVELRHEEEVKKAEDEAIRKVMRDHPKYTEDELRVGFSENVKKDDEKRKAQGPHHLAVVQRPGYPGEELLAEHEHARRPQMYVDPRRNIIRRPDDPNGIPGAYRLALPPDFPPLIRGQNDVHHHHHPEPPHDPEWGDLDVWGQHVRDAIHAPVAAAPAVRFPAPAPPPPPAYVAARLPYMFGGPMPAGNAPDALAPQNHVRFGGHGHIRGVHFFPGFHERAAAPRAPVVPKADNNAPRSASAGGQFLNMAANAMRLKPRAAPPAVPAVAGRGYVQRSPEERRARLAAAQALMAQDKVGGGGDRDDAVASPTPAQRQRQGLY